MKIIVTVIEINAGVAICNGRNADPYAPFVAVWLAPDGVRLSGLPSTTKQEAVDTLLPFVRNHLSKCYWLTVEDVEVEV